MRDVHTCSIGGVDLVGAMVGFTSVKLLHLTGQVLCRPRVHVPVGINGVGLSVSLWLLRRRTISHGDLTGIVAFIFAVIAKTKEASLEALMTLGGPVPIAATKLAHTWTTSPR